MPFHLAGVWIDGDHRIGIQVVSGTLCRVPIRAGIPGAPVGQVQNGIIRTGYPNRSTAALPGLTGGIFPCLMSRFAWTRNGVETPETLSLVQIVSIEESPNAI